MKKTAIGSVTTSFIVGDAAVPFIVAEAIIGGLFDFFNYDVD